MSGRTGVIERLRLRLEEHYGGTVQEVFGYLPSDFQGLSPAIALFAGGSLPDRTTPKTYHESHIVFIYFMVVYGVPGYTEWTEKRAQETLNTLYDMLKSFVVQFTREEDFWTNLVFTEYSETSPVKLAGRPYFMEIVPLIVQTYEGV